MAFGEIGGTLGGVGEVREGRVEEKGRENCIGNFAPFEGGDV